MEWKPHPASRRPDSTPHRLLRITDLGGRLNGASCRGQPHSARPANPEPLYQTSLSSPTLRRAFFRYFSHGTVRFWVFEKYVIVGQIDFGPPIKNGYSTLDCIDGSCFLADYCNKT